MNSPQPVLPRGYLVVLAGLPGAGKTTVLRRVRALRPELATLDSDDVREWLSVRLPGWLPYPLYRPLVHLVHHVRIVVVAAAGSRMVVHEPATRALARAWFAVLAQVTGRDAVLCWLDADPDQARAGQLTRGRALREGPFTRHVIRARRLRAQLAAGELPAGWTRVYVLPRTSTPRVRTLVR